MRPVNTPSPELVPIEELDRQILSLCVSINVATYELLTAIREFDERVGWLKWGSQSCAEWLAWRCDLSLATAREKVRVAHALKTLPGIASAFSAGELSYSKVRELTRVAETSNEDELVTFALRNTVAHVSERCRELRFGDAASTNIAERAYSRRALRIRRDNDRGMVTMTVELPLDTGDLIDKALDKARDDDAMQLSDVVDTSWSKRQADAFVDMVTEYLSGSGKSAKSDNYLVTIHVDQSALEGNPGRSSVPVESARRICCDGETVSITENSDGEPLSVGRKSRTIPTAIERAVRSRDGNCCRFPGCRNRRFLNCHHVKHWADGGETAVGNLMLLCTRHHKLVHEGGFRIEKNFQDDWFFARPDGIAVPAIGYSSQDVIDDDLGERFDPPRGGLFSAVERTVSEPRPPDY